MTKRVFLLNGLAILALICNHAVSWGYNAMFWWADRYRPVTVPNYDQVGTLPYYVLLVPHQLTTFTVPAFLFVSGFFVAYMSRGSQSRLSWKVVKTRIAGLLVPYLIWSVAIFVGDFLQGIVYTPVEYLARLVSGGAMGAYYFVPLLCQLYLLSPLLVPMARMHWRRLLFVSILLHWGLISVGYLRLFWGEEAPALDVIVRIIPLWLFPRLIFFFVLGIVFGRHLQKLKEWLARHKVGLLVAVVVLGVLSMIEPEVLYRTTGRWNWRSNALLISTSLYAVAGILCFLAFYDTPIPFSEPLRQLAKRTYGVYLLHAKVIEFIARVIRQLAPWMLARQPLFSLVLFISGLGIPLLFMASVARLPARKLYRYLFG